MNTRKIKVIGAGGIGGYLIEPLARYLSYSGDHCEITVIDGDKYEEKNKERQRFTALENKAEHTVKLLKEHFPKIHFKAKGEFLTEDNVISSIRENDVVFLCVDNHATRKLVSDRCGELDNVTLLSGGNDETTGDVLCYLRKDGVDLTWPPTAISSKIANPEDENPGKVNVERQGCEQQLNLTPQLLFTNLAIASMMLNCYRKYEKGQLQSDIVYVDIETLKTRPDKK